MRVTFFTFSFAQAAQAKLLEMAKDMAGPYAKKGEDAEFFIANGMVTLEDAVAVLRAEKTRATIKIATLLIEKDVEKFQKEQIAKENEEVIRRAKQVEATQVKMIEKREKEFVQWLKMDRLPVPVSFTEVVAAIVAVAISVQEFFVPLLQNTFSSVDAFEYQEKYQEATREVAEKAAEYYDVIMNLF